MTTDKYLLSPLAENDLEQIWLYTFERWSSTQADSYYRNLVSTFAALASGDKRGRASDVRNGYYKYSCGAHVIYYRLENDLLVVIRILHGRQDADRHL